MKLNIKPYLFCLLTLFFGSLFSQTKSDSLKVKSFKLKDFITSVEFGPQFCYRSISSPSAYRTVSVKWDGADHTGQARPDIYYDAKNDKPGIGFVAGLYGNFRIYKGLRLKFGFCFENFKYSTVLIDTLYIKYKENYPFHQAYTDKQIKNTTMTYEYNTYNLSPFELKYYFRLSRKIYLDLGIGASMLLRLSGSETGVQGFSNPSDATISINSNLGYKIFGNVGVNYFFSKCFGLSFAVCYQQTLTQTRAHISTVETIRLYSVGGKLGINF
ncbi:MAG: outer membrane beta-barrel protein [Bacteroidota bacterium]